MPGVQIGEAIDGAVAVNIRFLYSDGCPSHDEALSRLRKSIKSEGIAANVEVIRIEGDEDAVRLKFPGSPTILINDNDIDPLSNPQYGVTCRAYRLEDGRISPLPSENMIREALRKAKTKGS